MRLKKVGECIEERVSSYYENHVTNPGQDWYLKFGRLKSGDQSWPGLVFEIRESEKIM